MCLTSAVTAEAALDCSSCNVGSLQGKVYFAISWFPQRQDFSSGREKRMCSSLGIMGYWDEVLKMTLRLALCDFTLCVSPVLIHTGVSYHLLSLILIKVFLHISVSWNDTSLACYIWKACNISAYISPKRQLQDNGTTWSVILLVHLGYSLIAPCTRKPSRDKGSNERCRTSIQPIQRDYGYWVTLRKKSQRHTAWNYRT